MAARISGFSSAARVGEPVEFRAVAQDEAERTLTFRWDLGDGTVSTETAPPAHAYTKPGFYRVGVTVSNGPLAALAFRDFLVVNEVEHEYGTEGQPARWGFELEGNEDGRGRMRFSDDTDALCGGRSLRFTPDPYLGAYVAAQSCDAMPSLPAPHTMTLKDPVCVRCPYRPLEIGDSRTRPRPRIRNAVCC
jgi:hypothetical protein